MIGWMQIQHSKITKSQKASLRFPPERILLYLQNENNFSCLPYTVTAFQSFKLARPQPLQQPKWGFFLQMPTRIHFWEEILWGVLPDPPVLLVLLWLQDLPRTFHVLAFHIICYFCLTVKKTQGERKKNEPNNFPEPR